MVMKFYYIEIFAVLVGDFSLLYETLQKTTGSEYKVENYSANFQLTSFHFT